MLKTLLKKQMAEIFRNYFYDPKKNKMRSRGATAMYIALYVLLMAGVLGGMFALLAVGICALMAAAGVGWLYYLVMGLIAVLLGAFGSVFSTYSSLYLSKDNDLLLSMPVPVRYVMASRLLGVYLLGLMYSGVATVPAVIVYWIVAPVTAGTIVGGVLMVLIVSVIVMVLSCLLGWVVARISLKLKNKSFITVLLSLLFLAAYYFVYYKAQALITLLVENGLSERHAGALLRLDDPEERLSALRHIIRAGLNVAQTEQYVSRRLEALQATPPAGRRTFILKDVRLFLNSIDHQLDLVRAAGVGASRERQETEQEIVLTIRIPKSKAPLSRSR